MCAAPAYLARHGTPATVSALTSPHCSVFRHPASGQVAPWRLQLGGELIELAVTPYLCTNDGELELGAVLAGRCIG